MKQLSPAVAVILTSVLIHDKSYLDITKTEDKEEYVKNHNIVDKLESSFYEFYIWAYDITDELEVTDQQVKETVEMLDIISEQIEEYSY